MVDPGQLNHSPSAALMELADIDHMSDFEQVVQFLSENLDKIIQEVHGFDKLLLDNGKTQLNCPPAPEPNDSHGSLLVRTLSEKEGPDGITLKREFKVHDLGAGEGNTHKIEIREDIVQAPEEPGNPPVWKENVTTVNIVRP